MTAEPLDLAAIRERVDAAHDEVVALCEGKRWTMQVPARPDKDSDLVITNALTDAMDLLAEVERLRAEAIRVSVGIELLAMDAEPDANGFRRGITSKNLRALLTNRATR